MDLEECVEKGLLQKTSPNTQYAGKEWREALLDLAEAEELFLENASSAASSPAITPCSTQQKESSKSRMEGKSPLRNLRGAGGLREERKAILEIAQESVKEMKRFYERM